LFVLSENSNFRKQLLKLLDNVLILFLLIEYSDNFAGHITIECGNR